jgi:hypothetical protein
VTIGRSRVRVQEMGYATPAVIVTGFSGSSG